MNQMQKMYVFKDWSDVHGKYCYTAYYPVPFTGYIRFTLHDTHVNSILSNLCKTKKYLIKIEKPSDMLIKHLESRQKS